MKYKLKPLKEIDEKVFSDARVCIFDGRNFLDSMRCKHMCFVLIPKDGKEEVEEVLAKVADLLEEFLDTVLDNVPNRLPLV